MADVLEVIDQVTIIESVEGGVVTELVDQAVVVEVSESGVIVEGGGGVSDHGALAGLGDDDHPQYLTEARGDARYEALGAAAIAAAAAGAAHVAAADPHPQYLTAAEANAAYALIADLAAKAPLASPGFTGTPTAPTAAGGTNTEQLATTAFVAAAIAALVNSSPAALDTFNELAAALGIDPNFATTIINALAGKAPLSHAHLVAELTDATAAGKALVTAADAAAQTALLAAFTTALKGLVPAPGNVTGKFLKDDGSWDMPAGGGGGTLTTGSATLDFGSGGNEASIAVTGQGGILATSTVRAFFLADATTADHTSADHRYAPVFIHLTCGTPVAGDGFIIHARSVEKMTGQWSVHWQWS